MVKKISYNEFSVYVGMAVPTITRIARARLGVVRGGDAAQTALCAALEKFQNFDPDRARSGNMAHRVTQFVVAQLRNAAKNEFAAICRENSEIRCVGDDNADVTDFLPDYSGNPESLAIARETVRLAKRIAKNDAARRVIDMAVSGRIENSDDVRDDAAVCAAYGKMKISRSGAQKTIGYARNAVKRAYK